MQAWTPSCHTADEATLEFLGEGKSSDFNVRQFRPPRGKGGGGSRGKFPTLSPGIFPGSPKESTLFVSPSDRSLLEVPSHLGADAERPPLVNRNSRPHVLPHPLVLAVVRRGRRLSCKKIDLYTHPVGWIMQSDPQSVSLKD